MTIEQYFQHNNISPENIFELSSADVRLLRSIHEKPEYYTEFFKRGIDEFLESASYEVHLKLYSLVLEEAKKLVNDEGEPVKDVFEPCCGSGLLGCYLASEGFDYKGMDANKTAIEKARKRAKHNGLDKRIFVQGDVLEYKERHEAVVGKCAANDRYLDMSPEMIAALASISNNVLLVVPFDNKNMPSLVYDDYEKEFKKHGFDFEIVADHMNYRSMLGTRIFVMKATKN